MKSRIQLAGVEHGSKEKTVWRGDLPVLSGFPGMRLVLNHPGKDSTEAFTFKQMCIEINTMVNEAEQVVYVVPVDRTKPIEFIE